MPASRIQKLDVLLDNFLKSKHIQNPKTKEMLSKIFAYRIADPKNFKYNMRAGGIAGGATGALGGALSADSEEGESALKRALVGALAGGGAGVAGGRYAPIGAQKLVGRVVTNLRAPYNYAEGDSQQFADLYKKHGLKKILRAVLKDEPLYPIFGDPKDPFSYRTDAAREFLYKRNFGLDPRIAGAEGFFKVNKMRPTHVQFNPKNKHGQEFLKEMQDVFNASKAVSSATNPNATKFGTSTGAKHSVAGGLLFSRKGSYYDPWDFGLNPGEDPTTKANFIRGLINMFSTPTIIHGKVKS